jgi:hypothetical protein
MVPLEEGSNPERIGRPLFIKVGPHRQKDLKKIVNNAKKYIEVVTALFILMKENKKWWLLPIFIIFAILSFFICLTGNQPVIPAIYSIF